MPLFVVPGTGVSREIPALPGHFQLSRDGIVETARQLLDRGVHSVLLLGIPDSKDDDPRRAAIDRVLVPAAIEALRRAAPALYIIADTGLCQYSALGHCGVVRDGSIDNDLSLGLIADVALCYARAGAHALMISSMLDGAVGAVRDALDVNGFAEMPLMAQFGKAASAFYGPFRQATDMPRALRDKSTYQLEPGNTRQALREARLDLGEGADVLVIKPALAYLDILATVKRSLNVPAVAFSTSGEYGMIKAGAACGAIDAARTVHNTLASMIRAGADMVITYFAMEFARAEGNR